ncbi:MAG: ABC transporter ATP-binding protein [Deltaproteobacteria bacterium]|nr:ABC transporter ATP-binding protein [Deltaproteobacteria bacterium]MBW1923026.1 ABC transporter ATP-binding protein [Deltaproteobacteria bacterium]MBW1950633.1 ABC transporter ATP-binding protein [Deltaproteobacteria bacterium]MBW2007031.1 ABC transporter ATP-binding protein [Deltaproteobacteria bacterium]MBW2348250.1 ABC transporter ATP-binding protein [Deltaproteobacteria bacterium]
MLVLENIHKSFDHRGNTIEVLRGIDLEVREGESISIMGASGEGKSTLLHIMGSLEPPSEGSVRFNDRDLYAMDEPSLCRLRNKEIGFVFQFHHLLPEFNAVENTMMPALIARYPKRTAYGMAEEALRRVGLEGRMTHRTGELSGGEQQRVAIARALVMGPKLLLADEPTGNLDWQTGREIAELLRRLQNEAGLSMVLATHNQSLARSTSKQMELSGGKLH